MDDDRAKTGDNPARQEQPSAHSPERSHPHPPDIAMDVDLTYDPDEDPTVRSFGVMGSSGGELLPEVRRTAFDLGRAIAEAGCNLVTGACPGLPYDSARGAQAAGGLSIGISPALSRSEHVKRYESPVDAYDAIIYTGSGLMGREVHNIHSSDIIIIIGGRSGTLGEFCIAYDEGKLIGVLQGSGGIADALPDVVADLGKDTGAVLIYDRDPRRLVERCIEEYRTSHFRRPSTFVESAPA
ncbi:MAG: protein containing YHS domain protein [Candidatus Eremiobacteraeota bacterium]|nr:protein containing YHS domain protein [Candidatus Eremiobacteraeota bacterium]MBV8366246.1 protein containing YHS domain protein [Candidatus Eremiobacteraeota bacterium]